LELSGVYVFTQTDKTDLCQFLYHGLEENTYSLQLALKNTALGL